MQRGRTIGRPPTITFPDEAQLAEVFNDRTYRLLRIIRAKRPASIHETARLVDRDVKNVHQELTTLEAIGAITFERAGRSKQPEFPFWELIIKPFGDEDTDPVTVFS